MNTEEKAFAYLKNLKETTEIIKELKESKTKTNLFQKLIDKKHIELERNSSLKPKD